MPEPRLIRIIIGIEDVRAIAEENDIDFDLALERAESWGKYIEETASTLVNEQLHDCIVNDQP
jgi:hypothetical protein